MFSRYAKSSGEYDRNDPNVVYKTLKKEFTPHDFLLPASYYIHRIEVANTMLAMKVRQGWSELPAEFLSEYEKELKFLAKFRTA